MNFYSQHKIEVACRPFNYLLDKTVENYQFYLENVQKLKRFPKRNQLTGMNCQQVILKFYVILGML
jgi:hypothetical protein